MAKLNVTVSKQKCQAHGACLKTAPGVFRLSAQGKAEVPNASVASDELILAAARGCPYRAITVTDAETGLQIFPSVRR
jgi:ferredoxin